MDISKEGSIFVRFEVPGVAEWATDSIRYQFPTFEQHGVKLDVTKTEDRHVQVKIFGPSVKTRNFHVPMPKMEAAGFNVAVTWSKTAKLYVNGKQVAEADL